MPLRSDLAGITMNANDGSGEVMTVVGTPEETGGALLFQWGYRGAGNFSSWPAGLTKVQFRARIRTAMDAADAEALAAAYDGEEV